MSIAARWFFCAFLACAAFLVTRPASADYVVNGGESIGTYRIPDNGIGGKSYFPPPGAPDVETYGEDFAVTPDLKTVYQFTNSLGHSIEIYAYDVGSHAYLPDKLLTSGFYFPGGGQEDFILNARMSLIRPIDPLGKGDLFTISGSFPFLEGLTPQIKRYDRATNSYVETIDPPTPQSIHDFGFGPDHRLYMAAQSGIYVYQETATGFDLVSATPLLGSLTGRITFGPEGHLYLVNPNNANIERYTTTGVFVDTFASGVGGQSIQFGVDGNLHALTGGGSSIKKYNGTTGVLLSTVSLDYAVGRITYVPVPEPSSLLLAAIGAFIAATRLRRNPSQC